jgi:porphobilinogen synthase
MVRETRLDKSDLIYPLFVRHGKGVKNEIASMPGNYQFSVDTAVDEVGQAWEEGVRSVILFGLPEAKDEIGSEAFDDEAAVQMSVRSLKEHYPELLVITDVCMCEYTSHGHCGIIRDNDVDNDPTLALLAKAAVSHFSNIAIMAYAAKYASAFYGPFRDAADSAPQFGDRNSYQMDPANSDEALTEVQLDLEEGADIVMVKPAMAYLDIVRRVKDTFQVPVAAYNVSGEFSMVMAGVQNGWIDRERMILEVLTCIKRAGTDMILTYHAREAARLLG